MRKVMRPCVWLKSFKQAEEVPKYMVLDLGNGHTLTYRYTSKSLELA